MKTQKKLYFLIPNFKPGGAEHVIVDLSNYLSSIGIDVVVIAIDNIGVLRSRLSSKIEVVSLNTSLKMAIFKLTLLFLRERPKILISTPKESSFLAILANILSGNKCKVIAREANTPSAETVYEDSFFFSLKNFIFKRIIKHAAGVVALTPEMAMDLSSFYNICTEKITIIPNPIDNKKIIELSLDGLPAEFDHIASTNKNNIIVCVGRLYPTKNVEFNIRLIHYLKENNKNYILIIVGDGFERKYLEDLALELGVIENIVFAGYQENPYKFISKSKIFLMSSLFEGLPNALLQACALGKICLVSDSPGAGPRIVEESKSGFVFKLNSLEDAYKKIALIEGLRTNKTEGKSYVLDNYGHKRVFNSYLRLFSEFTSTTQ